MSATGPDLVRYLRTLAAGQVNDACTDQQLLEQFVTRREETSFAALVHRHGPMVLGVCRRVLGHDQDAEDAFQATFLVLVRKAGSIRKHESFSSWLHGVAYHVAEKLRAKELRRAVHERKAANRPSVDPAEDVAWREIRCLLDSELARLPERYRGPLVLCYLQGKTQDEAARQLDWSLRTFRRRLQCARDLLSRRLIRRGVTLSAALSAPLLADAAAQAALSPLLVASTVRAGLASATGQTTGALISAQVESLAQCGVGSLLTKKASIAVVLLLSLLLGIGGLLAHRAVPSGTRTEAPAAPPPQSLTAHNASNDKTIKIKGRVLDPDGKPLTGAHLFLLANATQERPDVIVRSRTDKEGSFHFTAKPEILNPKGKTTLAATANGFGPDWVDLTTENKDAITLRLVKDDVPLRGRVLDLEGKPVAGATVRAVSDPD
jgi:RNA polymerase sigma factor (sigma-70 family)